MGRRRYPKLENKVGSRLPAQATPRAIVRKKKTPAVRPQNKLQVMLEKTVQTLLLTASTEGDLTFRADIKAAVLNDLSVDVSLWGKKQLLITFYTEDASVRRLIQGYERELIAHLESRGLKVKQVRVLNSPDPNEAPPVPVT